MKNIQIIDGADNCAYEIYAITDDQFQLIFPNGQDIEFVSDFTARVGHAKTTSLLNELWESPCNKKEVNGIHGTIFFELDYKKPFYPTRKESEMVVVF